MKCARSEIGSLKMYFVTPWLAKLQDVKPISDSCCEDSVHCFIHDISVRNVKRKSLGLHISYEIGGQHHKIYVCNKENFFNKNPASTPQKRTTKVTQLKSREMSKASTQLTC
jgi:hypothetical protein